LAPQRVVSTAPSITEIVFAVGAGDRLVGVTTYCNYPEAAKRIPKIGGFRSPNIETILSMRPDIVFVMKDQPETAGHLSRLGIRTVGLEHETVPGILNSIRVVARELDIPARGEELATSIRRELDSTPKPRVAGPRPKVLFIVGRTPGGIANLQAAGGGSYLNELIGLAGGTNLFADTALAYPMVSMEEIISRNPDVIIDMGHADLVTEAQKNRAIALWKQWPSLSAVQQNAVFPIVADYFITPGPRVALAVRDIRSLLSKVNP
jgi:iron complex transport system substrate-binding protein